MSASVRLGPSARAKDDEAAFGLPRAPAEGVHPMENIVVIVVVVLIVLAVLGYFGRGRMRG